MRQQKSQEEGPVAGQQEAAATKAKTGKKADNPADVPAVKLADDKASMAKLARTTRKKSGGNCILVPVDFSEHSESALVFAAELAQKVSGGLMILHVVHDPGEMPGYYTKLVKKKRADRISDIARDVFDEFLAQAVKKHPDLKAIRKAESVMVIGLPVTRILQMVEKVKPYLVVMGSQGRTGLKHLFLGSKAEQVVHLCPVPVTIVKNNK